MNRFFISAWGSQDDAGIYTYELRENGEPVKKSFVPLLNAGYLAWNSRRSVMYATCGVDETSDGVAAFSANQNGVLSALGVQKSSGISCCHLCVSPDDRFVYAANYRTGNFAEFPVLSDGSLDKSSQVICHSGRGPNKARQESAHAHFCSFSPEGKYLLVVDLGIDAVMAYPYTPGRGIDPAGVVRSDVAPGAGPRHLVFDRSGRTAYLITELGNTVISMHYADGRLEKINEISTLPCRIDYPTKASAVRLSQDERFLIATNRGFDSLAVIALDGRGGMVLSDLVLSGGSSPRDVNFLASDRFFAAGNEFSDNVYFFNFNRESGRLTPNGYKLELPRPLCFIE